MSDAHSNEYPKWVGTNPGDPNAGVVVLDSEAEAKVIGTDPGKPITEKRRGRPPTAGRK